MSTQWTIEQANEWGKRQPWRVGANFLPSSAINQLEMWQAESFDETTIDRELGWAASIGMNVMRVYLHDLLYEADAEGFLGRMDRFLTIAERHGISALFVFFDDCWNPTAALGPQPAPQPGVHNSGWVRSPQDSQRNWPKDLARLEQFVKGTLERFKDDPRVYLWDLYNEPGNSQYGDASLVLLQNVFEWAWAVRPAQPLTVGVWFDNALLNEYQLANSDVVSFHNYNPLPKLEDEIASLKLHRRPLICTEWMARNQQSLAPTHLPVFRREHVACVNWGLVAGKMQTQYPWGSPSGAPEPDPWFHDLFRPDGTPYREEEVAAFRSETGRGN